MINGVRQVFSRIAKHLQPAYVMVLLVTAVGATLLLKPHTKVHTQTTVSTPQTTQTKTQVATPQPTATPTPPKPTPAPAAKPKATHVATATTTAPVVTPAPSSNVDTLTPSTPSSSSSGGSASSQQTNGYSSTNWSGYLAGNQTFTSVSGSWVVPAVTGNGTSTTADAAWIGIGGVTSGDLIQVGTEDTVSRSGHVTTSAFYEMLPAASQTIPTMTVSAGDSMTASVTETSSGQWTITITDNTTTQTFTISVAYTSSHSTAEWIEEDPSYLRGSLVPFDNFGTINFSGSSAVGNSVSQSLTTLKALPITLVNNSGQAIATPSAISGGASFSVTHN